MSLARAPLPTVDWHIDSRVERASTLPSRVYTDIDWWQLERARIFHRTWQLVSRTDLLSQSGNYVTEDCAGRSLVVLRDGDALRAFDNVCRHRAGPLSQGCGRRQSLQCRYHGWTYGLDGQLLKAPGMEGVSDFEKSQIRLSEVQIESIAPMVFANMDTNAPSMRETFGSLLDRLPEFQVEQMHFLMRRIYPVRCNWKVYVDNYLEGYHIPPVHPSLFRELDFARYEVETFRQHARQHAPLRPVVGESDRVYQSQREDERAEYYWLFPNVMLNLYLGQLQTNVVVPTGIDTCDVIFDWYVQNDPGDRDHDPEFWKRVDFSELVQVEDTAICEAVQKNLQSGVYDRGRFSPRHENGVHLFHGLVTEYLSKT